MNHFEKMCRTNIQNNVNKIHEEINEDPLNSDTNKYFELCDDL